MRNYSRHYSCFWGYCPSRTDWCVVEEYTASDQQTIFFTIAKLLASEGTQPPGLRDILVNHSPWQFFGTWTPLTLNNWCSYSNADATCLHTRFYRVSEGGNQHLRNLHRITSVLACCMGCVLAVRREPHWCKCEVHRRQRCWNILQTSSKWCWQKPLGMGYKL